MKIIFSKSTDHVEHFHILRFFNISRTWMYILITPPFQRKLYTKIRGGVINTEIGGADLNVST